MLRKLLFEARIPVGLGMEESTAIGTNNEKTPSFSDWGMDPA